MTPWVLRLIVANVVIFFITLNSPPIMDALMFVPAYILIRPWTLISYMFLHGGMGHIFFNMISLFFFGPRLELVLGGRRFLMLYFISGIAGALLSFIFSPDVPIIGASGAIFGVMLGFAYFWPREPIYVWGILPIEARWMVVGMTLISIVSGYMQLGQIAHFAHLGGFLGGYLFLKVIDPGFRKTKVETTASYPATGPADLERWSKIQRENLHVVNREELDRIFEKIKATGVGSLTSTERAFLDRFSTQ